MKRFSKKIGLFPFYLYVYSYMLSSCTNPPIESKDILGAAVLKTPLNNEDGVSVTPLLEWTHSVTTNYTDLRYRLYIQEEGKPETLVADNLTTNSFQFSDSLNYSAHYLWRIVSTIGSRDVASRTFFFTTRTPVEGVSADQVWIYTYLEESDTVSATLIPSYATNKNIKWISDNESVATVSNSGVVTGISVGEAHIIVVTEEGEYKDTVRVTVPSGTPIIPSISLISNKIFSSIPIGQKDTIVATVLPNNAADRKIVWTSSDKSIADVDTNGVVTGIATGNATITAMNGDLVVRTTVIVWNNTFTYNGHTYYVKEEAKTWSEATQVARQMRGHLLYIESKEEQVFIEETLADLLPYIPSPPKAADGGGASYMWIGATDEKYEGSWRWSDEIRENTFGNLTKDPQGAPLYTSIPNNAYSNWGKVNDALNEPNDDNNDQDYAAIALDDWTTSAPANQTPAGRKYQWNSLSGANQLFYIIEIDR